MNLHLRAYSRAHHKMLEWDYKAEMHSRVGNKEQAEFCERISNHYNTLGIRAIRRAVADVKPHNN